MSEDTVTSPTGESAESFPLAEVRPVGPSWRQVLANSKLWWLTAVCAVTALAVVLASTRRSGTQIVIRFDEGHGVKPGDRLRYRGIDVGEVTGVELDANLGGVRVQVELQPQAKSLARNGSRFWIERPQLGLARMSGLETVVGAKHLGVIPGPEDAPACYDFEGVETPPVLREATTSEIVIRFREGHGLTVGDVAKFRGIVVGEVTQVTLNGDLSGIEVRVRLAEGANAVARTGSQFWVERPQLTAAEVRGLDTLVGGRYLGVLPGASDSPPQTVFDGLDQPPPGVRAEGGLEVVLESPARHGLQRGAPVYYRGHRIGYVLSVALAPDATGIEARVYVEPDFKPLVRDNSVFYRSSGIDVSIGLSGVQLSADTLTSIAVGGVTLATPDPPGKPVPTGHRFVLNEEKRNEWAQWRPPILLGDARLPDGLSLPQPQRAVVRWSETMLGLPRSKERSAWILPMADGLILGPTDFLIQESAPNQSAVVETMGMRFSLESQAREGLGPLSLYQPPEPLPDSVPRCDPQRFRRASSPEDCLLVGDPMSAGLPLLATRLIAGEDAWDVDPALPLDAGWHGAAVVAQRDGMIVGMLLKTKDGARVVPVPTVPE